MKDAEQKLEEIFRSGSKPTCDQLEEALLCVLHKRNDLQSLNNDMAAWLASLAAAYTRKDAVSVADTIEAFIAKHVQLVPKAGGRLH